MLSSENIEVSEIITKIQEDINFIRENYHIDPFTMVFDAHVAYINPPE